MIRKLTTSLGGASSPGIMVGLKAFRRFTMFAS